ncbi:hypothetical protein OUHCRE7_45400 [Enterobacter hormaechei subsp. hoffmannii]
MYTTPWLTERHGYDPTSKKKRFREKREGTKKRREKKRKRAIGEKSEAKRS